MHYRQTHTGCLPTSVLSMGVASQLTTAFLPVPSDISRYPFLWGLALPADSSFIHRVAIGIALGYGLDYRGSRVRFPAGAGNFSLHHRVQNGSGAHPASYPIGTRGSFPGGKAAGAWSWPHLRLVPRSKNEWNYTSTPQYAFMAWCLAQAQGQLYLLPFAAMLGRYSN
jgi:hypothetical protein